MEPYEYLPTYAATVDYLLEANPDALFADGLEVACIGHTEIWEEGGSRRTLAVYSKQKIIRTLVDDQGMTPEEAEEYADFNVYSAYMGPNTPLYVDQTYAGYASNVYYQTQPVLPQDMYEL
jgi:hypothetical protein